MHRHARAALRLDRCCAKVWPREGAWRSTPTGSSRFDAGCECGLRVDWPAGAALSFSSQSGKAPDEATEGGRWVWVPQPAPSRDELCGKD